MSPEESWGVIEAARKSMARAYGAACPVSVDGCLVGLGDGPCLCAKMAGDAVVAALQYMATQTDDPGIRLAMAIRAQKITSEIVRRSAAP